MPRKIFVLDPTRPYHLVARSNNKDWYSLPLPQVWEIYSDYLWFLQHAFEVRNHAFVLMNNHFHWIASFPNGNLSAATNYFLRETSRVIGFESKRINHVYGGRIFRSCLGSNHYFEHAYKYLYRNPVEAGLCDRVEDYEYSTFRGLVGMKPLTIPVDEDTLLFDPVNFSAHLEWLNRAPLPESREAVRKALRRAVFKLPRHGSSGKRNPLEDLRY